MNGDALKRARDAGVDRVVFGVPSEAKDKVLPVLDKGAAAMRAMAHLRMRPPRRGIQEFHFLGHDQRAELEGKALGNRCWRIPPPSVRGGRRRLELPHMHELVDRTGVALEVADEILVVTAFVERGVTELLVELVASAIFPTYSV